MKQIVLAITVATFAAHASAQSCTAQSKGKKLAGAAQASFMKKCLADAVGS